MPNSEPILAIIRGDVPISRLDEIGIHISQRGDDFAFELREDHPLPAVAPRAVDIAQGLLKYRDNPEDLQQWGRFMMMSSAVDLGSLEEHPRGDMLLNALWDASFEGTVNNVLLATLYNIARDS